MSVIAGAAAWRRAGGLTGDAGGLAPQAGRVQHQVDQGIGAAGVHAALIVGAPGVAGVLIEHGEHSHGVGGARVAGNRVHNDQASPTRHAAVRAEALSIKPTSATAES